MKEGYNIIVNTAAGRRRYLQYLIPLVISNNVIDRYDLWVNTTDKVDIAFLERMATLFPKINLIWQPDGIINGVQSINAFYKYCCDENTIYIKLDDDIIWLEPNFFDELIDFRINNPDYFLVSPLVINNDISTYILQANNLIKFNNYFEAKSYNLKWYNGYFAKELHDWFFSKYLIQNKYKHLHCGHFDISLNRYAINAVSWFGQDFKLFNGEVIGDDEEFLTVIYPTQKQKRHCFDCNIIAVHFSFSMQREILDQTDILSKYKSYFQKKENTSETFAAIYNQIQIHLIEIEKDKHNIMKKELPHSYKQISLSENKIWKKILSKILGINIQYTSQLWNTYTRIKKSKRKYIIQ